MDDKLKSICKKNGIYTIEDLDDKIDGDAYLELYDYWLLNGMPYGTAKARDGDPDQWIFDQMEQILPSREDVV